MAKKIIQDVIIKRKTGQSPRVAVHAPSIKGTIEKKAEKEKEVSRGDFFARQAAAREERQKEKELEKTKSREKRRERVRRGVTFMKRAACFGFKKRADDFRFEMNACVDERKGRGLLKKMAVFAAFCAIALTSYFSLCYFSYATVKITPHREFTDISARFRATKDYESGSLTFETSRLEKENTQVILATGTNKTGQKASGKIVVYNFFSAKPQKLVAGTRFESSGGKIFRTTSAIYVPGMGSIEATVYADKAGPGYNIGLSDFTLPAYKGLTQYTKIYARSKTEMRGGAAAGSKVVSKTDIENARKVAQKMLTDQLREDVVRQTPRGFILYNEAVKIDFIEDSSNVQAGDAAGATPLNFKTKGQMTAFLFNRDMLAERVADAYVDKGNGAGVADLDDLTFNLLSGNATITEIIFTLKGKGEIVWKIDESALVEKLMNVRNKKYTEVFKQYPYIDNAEIIHKPSWWRFMPNNKAHISVEKVME